MAANLEENQTKRVVKYVPSEVCNPEHLEMHATGTYLNQIANGSAIGRHWASRLLKGKEDLTRALMHKKT